MLWMTFFAELILEDDYEKTISRSNTFKFVRTMESNRERRRLTQKGFHKQDAYY